MLFTWNGSSMRNVCTISQPATNNACFDGFMSADVLNVFAAADSD
jgi:hypothetical protein